jgi:hypothetical protein
MSRPHAIAFFIWRRAELTAEVFQRIREVQPKHLIVIADGPKGGDGKMARECEATRLVTEAVDWDCVVHRDYAPLNIGLQARIETGLDFVFEHVDRAIILEDDCVPDVSFFPYCEELLERYKNDDRIACIAGDNSMNAPIPSGVNYGFSRYTMIWGWATWRRAWNRHDPDLGYWPAARDSGMLERQFRSKDAINYWTAIFNKQLEKGHNTWDYGLTLSCWKNRMVSIVPDRNMVRNTGFGEGATHTHDPDDPRSNVAASAMTFPLVHPSTEAINTDQLDAHIELKVFSGDKYAYGQSYEGVEFNRIRHGFGGYLDKVEPVPEVAHAYVNYMLAYPNQFEDLTLLDEPSRAEALRRLRERVSLKFEGMRAWL